MWRRLFAWLLLLYPPAFRRAHGREMLQFVSAAEHDHSISRWRVMMDLTRSLPREWMHAVKHGTRTLFREPGFTVTAVVTLALAIGANVAIFSLVKATILQPVRVADPDALVAWSWTSSYPDYKVYASRTDIFTGVLATSGDRMSVSTGTVTELRDALYISGNGFSVLGVGAEHGRVLLPSDERPDAPLVAVLGYGFWRSRFNGDEQAIGRTLAVNGRPVTIVGVAARDFRGTSLSAVPDVYLPLTAARALATGFFAQVDMLNRRGFVWLNVTGRLRPDVTREQASSAMDVLYDQLDGTPGGSADRERLVLTPLPLRALGDADAVRRFVWLLVAVVTVTLLIGCANLANLQLARASARRRDVAVHLALGASRRNVVQHSLIESLMLAVVGGVAGLAVAKAAFVVLSRFQLPGGLAIERLPLELDLTAMAMAFALSLVTGVLFGAVPAWRAGQADLLPALRDRTSASGTRHRMRQMFVAIQVALSLALLAGSGLFLRSLVHALDVPLGFVPEGAATASVNLGLARFDEPRAQLFYDTARERIARLPNVVAAGWTMIVPTRGMARMQVQVDGYRPAPKEDLTFNYSRADGGYFTAAGTRLVAGRLFTGGDDRAPVALVNETAARRFWKGSAVGGRIRYNEDDAPWLTIVGVVEDTKARSLDESPVPFVYTPFGHSLERAGVTRDAAHLFVRTRGDVSHLLSQLGPELRAVDGAAPVYNLRSFAEQVRPLVMPQRMGVTLFAFFSGLSLVLVVVGIFGVASYVMAMRTREIGIRMALGADARAIRSLMLRQGLAPVALGATIGVMIAAAMGRFAAAFLVGVTATDPIAIGAAFALLFAAATAAVLLPARRAAALRPIEVLRQD